jgi:hypothetical protein
LAPTCCAAGALFFVFPDAVEHLHPAEKAGVAAPWLLKRLFNPSGTGFVVAQGEQRRCVEQE